MQCFLNYKIDGYFWILHFAFFSYIFFHVYCFCCKIKPTILSNTINPEVIFLKNHSFGNKKDTGRNHFLLFDLQLFAKTPEKYKVL